jgi:DNA-directed RNA polymerase specialized sigma24 family protein
MPWIEPGLERAVAELTEMQRVSVVLVHGFGWTANEVAELQGVKATTVQTHVQRALARLRMALEVEHDG